MKAIKKGEKLSKVFRGTVKSFDEKTHTAVVMISTKDVDRDGEVIEPSSFQKRLGNYIAHPVLLSSHRTETLTRQIGEAKSVKITEEGVEGVYEWYVGKGNTEADWGWFLVTKGIAAFSIGFIPFEWIDNNGEDRAKGIYRRFTEIELLENSQVLVPTNAAALQRRAQDAEGEEKELCALAIKEVKAEELKQFDSEQKNIEALRTLFKEKEIVDVLSELTKSILKDNVKFVADAIGDLVIEKLLESEKLPKHYSEILLEPGRKDGKQSSTKEEPESGNGNIKTSELIGAVKESVKESLK